MLAISLLMLFMLPFAMPLFGATADQASVPVCCRRSGKHHCMMASHSTQSRVIGTECPYHILPPAVMVVPTFAPSTAASIFAGVLRHPVVTPQVEARQRVSFDRSRQKRGPPLLSL